MHGGGRNDIWHNLNCKGKYAGEIRIELTYYDTRPREDNPQQRKQSAQADGTLSAGSGREGMSGPRQMNATKRRPLPADPTAPSPSPHTTPQPLPGVPPRAVEVPTDEFYRESPPLHGQLQQSQYDPMQTPPLNHQYHRNQAPYEEIIDQETQHQYPSPEQFGQHGSGIDIYGRQQPIYPPQSSQEDYTDRSYTNDFDNDLNSAMPSGRYSRENLRNVSPGASGNIDPRLLNQPHRGNAAPSDLMNGGASRSGYARSPMSGNNVYEASPSPHSQYTEESQDLLARVDQFGHAADEQPPMPPTHRHGTSRSTMLTNERDSYSSLPAIAPLNTRVDRGVSFPNAFSNRPRSSISSAISPMSTSPTSQQQFPSYDAVSSISSYPGPRQRRSHSPIRDSIRDREVYGESMPPSLTPGYDPDIAAEESERLIREQHMIEQKATRGPIPRYQQAAAVPLQQPRAQHVPRGFESIASRKERHRYSAPIPPTGPPARSQPISPNLQAVTRKSLSPQPTAIQRRQTDAPPSIPFSPDSFDVYNPSISSANDVNAPGARYNTPSEAHEAHLAHERKLKLGDGPIIGSDGRVIDPSDHLPTDTWAPEPEQKPVRKAPEVTIRFRQNGQQPIRQPLREARPNALPTPTYSHSSDNSPSTAAAARTRLQKKTRPLVSQPNSSPVLPSSYNGSPLNPATLRSSASDYPLRGDPNYGSYHGNANNGGNPMYGAGGNRSSAGLVPPPVPGKVPIGSGQEDWGTDALSEEMRRIDIGVGGGRGQRTRGRYMTTRDV